MSSEEIKVQNDADAAGAAGNEAHDEQLADNVAEQDSTSPVDKESVSSGLLEEVAKYKDQIIRLQAEMENVRRRAEMDVEKAHKYALEKFARDLLPVVDSLERTIETTKDSEDEALAGVRQGVEITMNMFLSTLNKFNLEQLDPVGEPFDPQYHEAMSLIEAPHAEPNSVVAVMQKGYSLNGRLVRPAMVMVSKPQPGNRVNEQA